MRTGTTWYCLAMFFGTTCTSSVGMFTLLKSMNSMPSCICSASISSLSVMKPFSCSTVPRRLPLPF